MPNPTKYRAQIIDRLTKTMVYQGKWSISPVDAQFRAEQKAKRLGCGDRFEVNLIQNT